ncbi:MAG: alpha/beta fold hydrolase [Jatrophihabitans sp.]
MTASEPVAPTIEYLDRRGGRIAYQVSGTGPLVVCVPGMGELRSSFRFLVPDLVTAGFRVAVLDIRGHGDSDATFGSYDDVALAGDIRALVEHLGGPAAVVGSSMGAAASVLAAVEHGELFSALVMTGPFVRDVPLSKMQTWMMRAAMGGPWARRVWLSYYPKFYPGTPPADFEQHRAEIGAAMQRKGHRAAFTKTTRTSHSPADAVLDSVRTRTLVVMGAQDPDFPDPTAEAHMIASRVHGRAEIVAESGHYPHAQRPNLVSPLVIDFLTSVTRSVPNGD